MVPMLLLVFALEGGDGVADAIFASTVEGKR